MACFLLSDMGERAWPIPLRLQLLLVAHKPLYYLETSLQASRCSSRNCGLLTDLPQCFLEMLAQQPPLVATIYTDYVLDTLLAIS